MERDFMGAAGNEQQRQRAAEDDGSSRKEPAYFGAGGPPPMDWSFASRAGAAPGVMSFRSAPREEQGVAQFSAFDGGVQKQQQASRVLTQQRSFGAESHGSPQYTAMRGAYGVSPSQQQQQLQQQRQHQQQQHAAKGARVIPGSSPFNPNNPMYKVQSSPSLPNGVAAGGTFKPPPFAVNSAAVAASRVGVYARNMPKPKMAQLTIFYAGSVNVFNNVSPEKAQELMLLASRGSLPSAPTTAARSQEANFFAPAKVAAVAPSPEAIFFAPAKLTPPEVSPATPFLPQKQQRFSPPASGISKPISSVSQPTCLSKSASSSNSDSTTPKFPSQLVMPLASQPPSTRPSSGQNLAPPTSQHPSARPVTLTSSGQPVLPLASQPPPTRPVALAATTAAATHPVALAAAAAEAIMPRAVPQARKASLARFLEKRKERVTTVAPYSSSKSPMESNDTAGSSIENNRSSCTGFAISSNSVWRPRTISFGGEPPSTNLHM